MRGEDYGTTAAPMRHSGSPPHARGRRGWTCCAGTCRRITPACAGKTIMEDAGTVQKPDHPRMRGEDSDPITVGFMQWGSPPHARGRQRNRTLARVRERITPACAGKTLIIRGTCRLTWDHPRMRGEDTATTSTPSPNAGSPPHARGRRCESFVRQALDRITPACAGKTQRLLRVS